MMNAIAKTGWKGWLARLTITVALAASLLAQPVAVKAQSAGRVPRGDMAQGRPLPNQTRPLPEIVAQVQATPPYRDMDYIGLSGFESRTMVYVLRFLDGRQVVVVQVDARSGRILGRTP